MKGLFLFILLSVFPFLVGVTNMVAPAAYAGSPLRPVPTPPVQSPVLIAPTPKLPSVSSPSIASPNTHAEEPIHVTASDLLANPQLLQDAMLSVIQDENLPGIKVLLPIYEKMPQHDASIVLYAQSLLFLEAGEFQKAHQGFSSLLARFPKSVPIRYHYAQTLFMLGYYAEAREQMSTILKENPGKYSETKVGPYLQIIRQMSAEQYSLQVNAYVDRNINNAPDKRTLGNCSVACLTFEAPKKSRVVELNWQWQKQWFLPHRTFLTLGYQWFNSWAVDAPEYSWVQMKVYQNMGVATPDIRAYLQPFISGAVRENQLYSMSYGIEMGMEHAVGRTLGLQWRQSLQYDQYTRQTFRNSLLLNLSFSQNWVPSTSQSFFMSQSVSTRQGTQYASDSYWSYGLLMGWAKTWVGKWQSRLSAHFNDTHFLGKTLLTPFENRRDRDYGLRLSIQYKPWRLFGLFPTLNFVWNRHASNSPLYQYSQREVNLSLSWDFSQ